MSQNDKKPKSPPIYKQGNLFTDQDGARRKPAGGTSRSVRRAELLSRLKEQRALTTRIVDKISDYGNLVKAFKQVKRNKGAGGVDGVTLDEYEGIPILAPKYFWKFEGQRAETGDRS